MTSCVDNLNANFDRWTREFMDDVGKSGSDLVDDNGTNPKYGDDTALCTETTSWYYAKFAYSSAGDYDFYLDDFKAQKNMYVLRDVFKDDGRLYCYRTAQDNWTLNTTAKENSGWVEGNTIAPAAGDVLFWEWSTGEHTQVVINCAKKSNGDRTMTFIDGPLVRVGQVDIQDYDASKFFCVGRIPEDD